MKICPNCKQTYSDDGLNFCLSDGSLLQDLSKNAPKTVYMDPPRVTNQTRWENTAAPPVWQNQPNMQRQNPQQAFAPPLRAQNQDQVLPIISLILGVLGFLTTCCWGGLPFGAAAIIIGLIGLSNEKQDPIKYGGRGLALGGIITGAVAAAIAFGLIILRIITL